MIKAVKTVIVGETQVGKTSLAIRAFLHNFDQTLKPRPTLGTEFFEGIYPADDNGNSIKFEVWDTAGQEAYKSITSLFFQNCVIAVLVFDVSLKKSIQSLDYYVNLLKENEPDCFIAVVGNKIDLKREISREEGENYTRSIGSNFYMETSALTGEGVQELFYSLAQQKIIFSKNPETIRIDETIENENDQKRCC